MKTYALKRLLLSFFLLHIAIILEAQAPADKTGEKPTEADGNDTSQFIIPVVIFYELERQEHNGAEFYHYMLNKKRSERSTSLDHSFI